MQYEGGLPQKPSEPIWFNLEDTPAGKAHGDQLVNIPDLSAHEDLRPLLGSRPARAVLAAPIKVGDRVVGVVQIDSHQSGIYTENDEAVFAQLAAQISSALDRARSLQSSQRTAKTQEIAATFANRVQAAGSHQKTLTEAANSYQGLLHANQVNIQLGQPPSPSDPPAGTNGSSNGSTNGSRGDKR
jgi:GAF domain-containing protein